MEQIKTGRVKSGSAADYHTSVLLEESINLLFTDKEGIYIDGTLGGGGHAAAILEKLGKGGKLLAFDKDSEAIGYCKKRFKDEFEILGGTRLVLYNDSYNKAGSITEIFGKVSGILLDLGVSSRQFDFAEKGFSFRFDAPIDMRFEGGIQSAEAILNNYSENELEKIFRDYGEEPFARVIARRIVNNRRVSPIKTTFDLKFAIEQSVPEKLLKKSLSRVFQALRIAVNQELEELSRMLENSLKLLKNKGRIVVISYHSLEDRIVKNFFKENAFKEKEKKSTEIILGDPIPKLKTLTPKPIEPSFKEQQQNPRSRSAKLRAAECIR